MKPTGAQNGLSGGSFSAAEIVDLYVNRPPYAPEALNYIIENAPAKTRLLDLGCGEGKIARPLTRYFQDVVAVDPSAKMIALGKTLDQGSAENLSWITATAEDATLEGLFDLVSFASSIHWIEPNRLFSKLAPHLKRDHRLAIVSGDEAFAPPWDRDWQDFLTKWVPITTGLPMGSQEWHTKRDAYLHHVNLVETQSFVSEPFDQSIDDFIRCQHSRNSFALSKLGDKTEAFRAEIREILAPHADGNGRLSYRVQTKVNLARAKEI